MSESDERIEQFLADIDEDAIDKRDAIREEVDRYVRAALEKAEKQAAARAQVQIDEQKRKLRLAANRCFAIEDSAQKRTLAQKRMEMQAGVFAIAREKLCAFVSGNGYEPFLLKSAQTLAKAVEGDAVLLVREQDMPLAQKLAQAFGRPCTVQADPSIQIGGCRLKCEKQGLLADDTLDERLRGQREWFLLHAGLAITKEQE